MYDGGYAEDTKRTISVTRPRFRSDAVAGLAALDAQAAIVRSADLLRMATRASKILAQGGTSCVDNGGGDGGDNGSDNDDGQPTIKAQLRHEAVAKKRRERCCIGYDAEVWTNTTTTIGEDGSSRMSMGPIKRQATDDARRHNGGSNTRTRVKTRLKLGWVRRVREEQHWIDEEPLNASRTKCAIRRALEANGFNFVEGVVPIGGREYKKKYQEASQC